MSTVLYLSSRLLPLYYSPLTQTPSTQHSLDLWFRSATTAIHRREMIYGT